VGIIGNVISFALLSVRINKTQNYGHKLRSLAFWDVMHTKMLYHLDYNVFNYFVSTALLVELNWQCQCKKGSVCISEWIVCLIE
jgi:hypothetical protein